MSNVQLDLEDLRKWAAFSFFTGIFPPKTSGLNSMSLISFWRFVEWADLSSTAFKRLTQKSLLPTIGFTVSSFIISLKKVKNSQSQFKTIVLAVHSGKYCKFSDKRAIYDKNQIAKVPKIPRVSI